MVVPWQRRETPQRARNTRNKNVIFDCARHKLRRTRNFAPTPHPQRVSFLLIYVHQHHR